MASWCFASIVKVPRYCPTYCYMPHIHRVSVVFHTFHDPIRGLYKDYNVHLTLSIHEVSCAAHKMSMQVTGLFQMTFVLMCVILIWYIEHYAHAQSTFFNWPVFILTMIHYTVFMWWVWKILLKLPFDIGVCVCSGGIHFHMYSIGLHTNLLHFCR